VSYADEFDAALAELAPDWASFECYLTVDDPLRLADARVALARANGRPVHTVAAHEPVWCDRRCAPWMTGA